MKLPVSRIIPVRQIAPPRHQLSAYLLQPLPMPYPRIWKDIVNNTHLHWRMESRFQTALNISSWLDLQQWRNSIHVNDRWGCLTGGICWCFKEHSPCFKQAKDHHSAYSAADGTHTHQDSDSTPLLSRYKFWNTQPLVQSRIGSKTPTM